jgi:hypothetical protein
VSDVVTLGEIAACTTMLTAPARAANAAGATGSTWPGWSTRADPHKAYGALSIRFACGYTLARRSARDASSSY